MGTAIVYSRAIRGIHAPQVTIEVHISNGLPSLNIVGMLETAVKESKDRVRSALLNARFSFPQQRITINLAPADLPKEGGRFDLPIALGILVASGQLPQESLANKECVGELGLTGELRAVPGILPTALAAVHQQRSLVLPADNAEEAVLIDGLPVCPATSLLDVCALLMGQQACPPVIPKPAVSLHHYPDMADVRGQAQARRALEIAAAGGHSILFSGPPGTGKTMLASRLPGILPEMTDDEAVATATIYSVSGQGFNPEQWRIRPFRAPHHTASAVALVGGGSRPKPGEISLAHHGVLFLDELPEFDRRVLEVLREPLESGTITISRAANQAQFPAQFQLIAAMNPCPCGYLGESRCHCTEDQIRRYRAKISGPLLDRIDMLVEVPRLKESLLRPSTAEKEENSHTIRQRVMAARDRQLSRAGKANNQLDNKECEAWCRLSDSDYQLLDNAVNRLGLSARAYHRILKLARTIADLAGEEMIQTSHLTEAITYRRLDTGAR